MAGLLDFLQSASNTAASNVSAPVDLIAWLLKKGGVNVGTPVGGSDWMAQKGLTKPVQQSAASLAGETAGLLAPMVAAAKAPQIAGGLLQGAENLAAPRTLNPQTGAIVWHGSPHKFDKFDASKIGTGEGAQAYGHGLYLAEAEDVAKGYQRDLSTKVMVDGKPLLVNNKLNKTGDWLLDVDLVAANGNLSAATRSKLAEIKDLRLTDPKHPAIKEVQSELARLRGLRGRVETVMDGNLYKVDLPDEAIAKMLDWDKPLSQQAAEVVAPAYQARLREISAGADVPLEVAMDMARGMTGQKAYSVLGGNRKAEETLRRAGIPGIRYLDGGSRGTGSGTSNFVVFPGEEGLLKILERNGVRLGQ